jgi:hypothetical protein
MYNRGGSKNRLKVGDEVLVLGPLDKNVIGVIERIVKSTDIDYGEATKNTKKSMFDDNYDEEVDDTYETLAKLGRSGSRNQSHKGGDKKYSTEEEIMADMANIVVQNVIPEEELKESSDEDDGMPELEEV